MDRAREVSDEVHLHILTWSECLVLEGSEVLYIHCICILWIMYNVTLM